MKIIRTVSVALFLITLFACLENPTPDELGLNFVVSTDKVYYEPGEPITITFTNMGQSPARTIELLVKEGASISFDKSPLFFMEIQQDDGSWLVAQPYEVNFGSRFPYHFRSNESKSWTSKKISSRYPGKKIRFTISYKDGMMNRHQFNAVSPVIEVGPRKIN